MTIGTITPELARQRMLDTLDAVGADYKVYEHRPIRNYDDAELARQESGFVGTESKSLALRSGDTFFVYLTLAGNRVDIKAIRSHLGGPKPKIVSDAELWERFAAALGAHRLRGVRLWETPNNVFDYGFDNGGTA